MTELLVYATNAKKNILGYFIWTSLKSNILGVFRAQNPYPKNKMSFKDQLQKGLKGLIDIEHKMRYIIFQMEGIEKEISKLEDDLYLLYDQLEELEKEKIRLTNHMKELE